MNKFFEKLIISIVIFLAFFVKGGSVDAQTGIFEDNFNTGAVDLIKWQIVDPTASMIRQTGGQLEMSGDGQLPWGRYAIISKQTFKRDGLAISSKITANSQSALGYGDFNFQNPGTASYAVSPTGSGGPIFAVIWENGSLVASNLNCGIAPLTAIYKMEIIAGGFDVYLDDGAGFQKQCQLLGGGTIDQKPVHLQVFNQSSFFDDLTVSADRLVITNPSRSVASFPETATLTIADDDGKIITIPYIQTVPDITVSAEADPSIIPTGGGVKFILNQGLPGEISKIDNSPPYGATFSGLPKGTYNINAYIIDGNQTIQSGVENADRITGAGVGDIITVIGASMVEGVCGERATCDWTAAFDKTPGPVDSWLESPIGSTSKDYRNFLQYGPWSKYYWKSFLPELNDKLAEAFGYPVFLMNEGWAGYSTGDYLNYMNTSGWQNRQSLLKPNKVLIQDLVINDAVRSVGNATQCTNLTPANQVADNLKTIIAKLENDYGASPNIIFLAKPSYVYDTYPCAASYLPVISQVILETGIKSGPDLWIYFQLHGQTDGLFAPDGVHLTAKGNTELAKLWAEAITGANDVNNDGFINSLDLKTILLNWLGTVTVKLDQLADGKINSFDFTVVTKHLP